MCRKKVDEIDKPLMSQDEILTDTKAIAHGLERLRNDHLHMIRQLTSNDDKLGILTKSLEGIELGIGEAQVKLTVQLNPLQYTSCT